MYPCTHANLQTCISIYYHTCMLAYLNLEYLHTWILAYFQTCILANLHICILACMHIRILIYFNTFIVAFLHTCILAYFNTYILAYLHTCILAYLHTCILAFFHFCILADFLTFFLWGWNFLFFLNFCCSETTITGQFCLPTFSFFKYFAWICIIILKIKGRWKLKILRITVKLWDKSSISHIKKGLSPVEVEPPVPIFNPATSCSCAYPV